MIKYFENFKTPAVSLEVLNYLPKCHSELNHKSKKIPLDITMINPQPNFV